MRWIALIALAACGSHKPAPAPPDPPGCGAATCTGGDICIEYQQSPGTATVPQHTDYTYRCSPTPETDSKYHCSMTNDRQHCVALIPARER